MKEFILEENEEILEKFSNVLVKSNENKLDLSVLLTNERIVLLKDIEKLNEVLLIIPLNMIKELKYINGVNKITFKDSNNEIEIRCNDFTSYRIQI